MVQHRVRCSTEHQQRAEQISKGAGGRSDSGVHCAKREEEAVHCRSLAKPSNWNLRGDLEAGSLEAWIIPI